MSDWPDREDPVDRFKSKTCEGCGRKTRLSDIEKFDYWMDWAYEKGHEGEEEYLWFRQDDDWYCGSCYREIIPFEL